MGLERGAVVEKLDGAWSAISFFRLGAWSGDQGTIDRSVERRCKNRVEGVALETPEQALHALIKADIQLSNNRQRCVCP